ncbi:C40 family peptidase [Brachybacterium sp. EF45031]|uniref:C40 family peptidase n=1 Tax=Brachybacterium sillae TaxID=2810536 RepID=UPI00217D4FAE|nr:NlpC/P60 family protein [Brachybacterium sillae]MCS6712281.1 C40 family peptidase [Brachybacterium sillae]
MAKTNTHRAAGRARTPLTAAGATLRSAGGAAVLGTVVAGAALGTGAAAQAAPAAPAQPAAQAASAAPATAPVAPTALPSGVTLRWGSKGAVVKQLQTLLNQEGADLRVDGKFGPRTHAAVKDFQRENDLRVDGIVGPQTRGALNGGGSTESRSKSTSKSTSGSGSAIVDRARSVVGTDYQWAGNSPREGFDCSGLVQYAYQAAGIDLPHFSGSIVDGGRKISRSQLQPGDIVYYPGHVAIYVGDGKIIDASRSKDEVVERNIWGSPSGYVTYR